MSDTGRLQRYEVFTSTAGLGQFSDIPTPRRRAIDEPITFHSPHEFAMTELIRAQQQQIDLLGRTNSELRNTLTDHAAELEARIGALENAAEEVISLRPVLTPDVVNTLHGQWTQMMGASFSIDDE